MEPATLGIIRITSIVLVSVIAGAAMSSVIRRVRGGRSVRVGLTTLELLRQESQHEPVHALASTSQLVSSWHDRLIAGRLSESEHQILVSRGSAMMHKIVATQLQGPLNGTSHDFKELMWTVLKDSVLSDEEAKTVRKALAKEPYLNAEQVAHIHSVLDAWQGEAPDAEPVATPAEATIRHAVA